VSPDDEADVPLHAALLPGGRVPPRLRVLLEDPPSSALVTDFDGTLAPIVADPETARAVPGATEALATLARRYGVVAVISGRPVSFLAQRLEQAGPSVRLFGVYGMEWVEDGSVHHAPEAAPWREPAATVVDAARTELAGTGVGVEDKGPTVTVHWRGAPDAEDRALEFSRTWAARTGLVVQPGRRSVEFRPPIDIDKGEVMERLGRGRRAACFFGDDVGDLAAFAALDRLAAQGTHTVRVAVADEETPPSLLDMADLVVQGPHEAVALLQALARESGT
jgi:trehalose 6-phosphate phosphatase